jgi:hypothetical protein
MVSQKLTDFLTRLNNANKPPASIAGCVFFRNVKDVNGENDMEIVAKDANQFVKFLQEGWAPAGGFILSMENEELEFIDLPIPQDDRDRQLHDWIINLAVENLLSKRTPMAA